MFIRQSARFIKTSCWTENMRDCVSAVSAGCREDGEAVQAKDNSKVTEVAKREHIPELTLPPTPRILVRVCGCVCVQKQTGSHL